jgi:hypothetical protein
VKEVKDVEREKKSMEVKVRRSGKLRKVRNMRWGSSMNKYFLVATCT